MTESNERVNNLQQAVTDVKLWVNFDGGNNLSRAVDMVLGRLEELESAMALGTSCTACAKVLDASIKETEAKERAVLLVEEYRQEARDARSWSDLLKKALMRSNEKYRKAHRRALEAEKKLSAMQRTPIYVTDHTFDGEEGGRCLTEIFGVACELGEGSHHMKPSRCPEPDTCDCDCSCLDQENLGHTCSLHSVQGVADATPDNGMTITEWRRKIFSDPVEELSAASVIALKAKDPSGARHCPAGTGGMCVYESQGYRRCAKGCEISPEF